MASTRRVLYGFMFLLMVSFGLFVGTVMPVKADPVIYVRPGGDDTNCDGTANVDYSAGVAPACAVQTIQKGIDLVDSGGIVHVAAGTYNENIIISKYLSLIGAGSGETGGTVITQDTAGAGDTKVGVIQITASGLSESAPLLIKDLRVEPDHLAGVSVGRFTEATGTTVSYLELDNVHVRGSNTNPSSEQERGFYVDLTSSVDHLVIKDCAFNNLTYGWYIQKQVSADTSNVQYVTVTGSTFNHNNLKGIYAEKLSDVTFTNCTVDGNGFSPDGVPTYFLPWMSGVDINLKAGNYQNFTFDNCTISNNGLGGAKEGVGLTIKGRGTGDNPSSSYTTYPATVDGVIITGGVVTGNERGLRFGEPGKGNAGPTNIVIEHVQVHDNVQTYTGTDGSAYGDLINTMQAGISVLAENNWWGVLTYDEIAALVSGEVDFDPWAYWDGTGWTDGLTQPTEVWVDDDWSGSTTGDSVGGHLFGYDAFASIQQGIDIVVTGGTVNVAAGTYAELLTIDKSLTLRGATWNVNKNGYPVPSGYAWDDTVEAIIEPPAGFPDDDVITVDDADDVTIEGFVIQALHRTASGTRMLVTVRIDDDNMENLNIKNNVIGANTNIVDQDGTKGRMNLYFDINPYNASMGLIDSTVSGNKIFGSEGNGNNIFIWASYHSYGATGPSPMTGTVIEDNEISSSHRSGIETAGGFSDLVIRNNTISENGVGATSELKYGNGILMIRGTGDKTDPEGYGPDNLTIISNTISGNGKNGIYMGSVNSNYVITGNIISDNGWDGIQVDLTESYHSGVTPVYSATSNITANYNEIRDNGAFGVQIIGTPTNGFVLDASLNWWGAADGPGGVGPGSGDAVSDSVMYCPWLNGALGSGNPAGPDGRLVTNLDTGEAFCTIQAAIDDASTAEGHTLQATAGVYNENIVLDKRLSLIGAGSGETGGTVITQDTAGAGDTKVGVIQVTASGLSESAPLLIKDLRIEPDHLAGVSVGRFTEATGTTVSYLELDNVHVIGSNTNPSSEQERGFYVDLTSSVDHLVIKDCAFNNLTYGWYIQKQVSADTSNVQYVTVTGSTFNHNNLKGIYAEKLSDVTFTNCTVDGNGFSPDGVPSYFLPWMSGVDINLKAGTYRNFTFDNCTITNNGLGGAKEGVGLTIKGRGTGDNPSSSYTTYPATVDGVTITGGVVTGNERGLRFGEPGKGNAGPTNVVVEHVQLHDNVQTYVGTDGSAYGDVINTMQAGISVLAENNWWGVLTYDEIAALVSGEVDFDPWAYWDGTGWTDGYTRPSEVWVDDDWAGNSIGDTVGGHLFGYDAFANIGQGVSAVAANGKVNVANGLYLESNITVTRAMTIQGESQSGVIIAPGGEDDNLDSNFGGTYQHGFIVQSSHVTIKDLTLDGQANPGLTPAKNNFRIGIVTNSLIGTYDHLYIENVTVQHIYRRGIQNYPLSTPAPGEGNVIKNCLVDDVSLSNGIYLITGGEITGNTVRNVTGRGIGCALGNCIITNNTVTASGTGIYHYNYGMTSEVATISSNTISNIETGMNLVGLTTSSIVGGPNPSDRNEIDLTGNPDAGIGIILWYVNQTVTIQNNHIVAAGKDAGIWLFHNEEAATHPLIQDNVLTATASDGTTAGEGTGIFLTDDGSLFGDENGWTYATLQGNTIAGFARGIDLYQNASTPVSGRDVHAMIGGDNTISNCGTGIRVFESDSSGQRAKATLINNGDFVVNNTLGIDVAGGIVSGTKSHVIANNDGVQVSNGGLFTLTHSLVASNSNSGINFLDTAGTGSALHSSLICNNGSYQINNQSANVVNAMGNWWGHNAPIQSGTDYNGLVNVDPNIERSLSTSADWLDPSGGTSLVAFINYTVSTPYTIPDGVIITWTVTGGTPDVSTSTVENGIASVNVTDDSTPGMIIMAKDCCNFSQQVTLEPGRVTNLDTGEWFATIQAAIDDADTTNGHTINATNGTYIESNIVVDKAVTIQGESRTGVVIAPAGEDDNLNSSFGGTYYNGFMVTSDDVTIRNLTLDGQANTALTPGKNNFRIGILNYADGDEGYNGLRVEDVNVYNIYRRGISLYPASTQGHVVTGCDIDNIQLQQAIYNSGAPVTITHNNINRAGMGIGLYTSLPAASGVSLTVTHNTLTNISGAYSDYYGHSWPSVGIYYRNPNYDATVIITGNELTIGYGDEEAGMVGVAGMYIYNADAHSIISDNVIDATGGTYNWGIYLGGCAGTTVKDNTFLMNERDSGIYLGRGATTAEAVVSNHVEGNTFVSHNSFVSDTLPVEGTAIVMSNDGHVFWMLENPYHTQNVIAGNTITGFVNGILMYNNAEYDISATIGGSSVTDGNLIKENDTGMVINGSVMLAANNVIRDNVVAGILLTGTKPVTATIGGAMGLENTFANNGPAGKSNINVTLLANTESSLLATYNDWGVTGLDEIEATIHHYVDDSTLAEVQYYTLAATAQTEDVLADGSSTGMVTGTLSGLYAPAGNTVAFATSLGTVEPLTGTTAPDSATTGVASVSAGTATITATAGYRSATATLTFIPNTLDHFNISAITDQTAGVNFSITITAEDTLNDTVTGYTGYALLNDVTGTLNPTTVGPFIAGLWTGPISVTQAMVDDQITANHPVDSAILGHSNLFTVTPYDAIALALLPLETTVDAGTSVAYTVIATDTYGNSWDATSEAAFAITTGAGGSWTGNTYTSEKAGVWTVTATVDGIDATATLTVEHAAAVIIDLAPDPHTLITGEQVIYTVTATDAFGNSWDATAEAGFDIEIGAGGSWTANTYTSGKAGIWIVTATVDGVEDIAALIVEPHGVATEVALKPAIHTLIAGETVSYIAIATDYLGHSWDATAEASFVIEAGAGGSWTDNTYTSENAGIWTVTVTVDSVDTTATLTVEPHGDAIKVVLTPVSHTLIAGEAISYIATATDYLGHSWDATAEANFAIDAGAGGSWDGNTYTSEKDGVWDVTATVDGVPGNADLVVNHNTAITIILTPDPCTMIADNDVTYSVIASDVFGNNWDAAIDATFEISQGAGGSWNNNTYTAEIAGSWAVTATLGKLSASASLTVLEHGLVKEVMLSPHPHTVVANDSVTYMVVVTDAYGHSWDASATADFTIDAAAGGSWSDNIYTAGTAGNWTVTASVDGVAVTAALTILEHGPVATVALEPVTHTMVRGESVTYIVTVSDAYGHSWDATKDSGFAIDPAAGGSWLDNVYTAGIAGTWTVTATVDSIDATAMLVVEPHSKATKVVLTPVSHHLTAGEAVIYIVTATDNLGNSWDATADAEFEIAAGAGGSWAGSTYTSEKAGTWAVTATVDGVSDAAKLSVNYGAAVTIMLSPDPHTVIADDNVTYSVVVTDAFGNSWDATASTTFEIDAEAGGSWNDSTYTAEIAGSWTVVATFGKLSTTATLTVLEHGLVKAVILSPTPHTLVTGDSVTYLVTATDAYGHSWDATSAADFAIDAAAGGSWSDSVYTAGTAGTWTVTATVDVIDATATLIVEPHNSKITKVVLTPALHHLTAGETVIYEVTATDSLGNSWDATADAKFAIDTGAGGFWKGNAYTSEVAGTWTVNAIVDGVSVDAELVVTQGTAVTIMLTPDPYTVIADDSVTYSVVATDAFGNSWDATQDTSFEISKGAGGSWSDSTYTAEVAGSWTVVATFGKLSTTATLTVLEHGSVKAIKLSHNPHTMVAGDSIAYTVMVTDAYGHSWDATGAADFTITAAAGGSWSDNVYTAGAAGTWTVTVTVDGIEDTATLTVLEHGKAAVVMLTPEIYTVTVGGSVNYTVVATDTYGNSWDCTPQATFEIQTGAGGAWSGNIYTSDNTGTWTVSATVDGVVATAELIVTPVTETPVYHLYLPMVAHDHRNVPDSSIENTP